MNAKMDLKNQSMDELEAIYKDLSHKIFAMRNELKTTHKVDKPHLFKEWKKERARVLTFLNQKGKKI